MGSLKARIKHAFAVDPPGAQPPTPEQQVPVEWICRLAARKHLTTPAVLALEMCRPLNWVFAQGMHVTQPAVWALTPERIFTHYRSFAGYLENRGSIEYMLRRVEHWETHFKALESGEAPPAGNAAEDDGQID